MPSSKCVFICSPCTATSMELWVITDKPPSGSNFNNQGSKLSTFTLTARFCPFLRKYTKPFWLTTIHVVCLGLKRGGSQSWPVYVLIYWLIDFIAWGELWGYIFRSERGRRRKHRAKAVVNLNMLRKLNYFSRFLVILWDIHVRASYHSGDAK